MAKLKVTAFKKSGKYYTSEVFTLKEYPDYSSFPDGTTKDIITKKQSEYTFNLWDDITTGKNTSFSPIASGELKGFIFVFDLELKYNEQGFLTYLLDRTED